MLIRRLILPIAAAVAALAFAGAAQASTDLALNAPVVASSTFSTSYPASQAVDGNTSTRWAAAQNATPDMLQVELNTSYYVNEVSIQWGTDYPTSYQIQTSGDGSASSWQTIYSTTSGNGGTDVITLPNDLTRFLRVVGLNQNDSWGNKHLQPLGVRHRAEQRRGHDGAEHADRAQCHCRRQDCCADLVSLERQCRRHGL